MRQRDYNLPSFSPKGCGCLVLLILLTPVIGVLVLQSFLCGNTSNAKKSEGKQYVGSMNKGQQAKFAENGTFVTSVDALELGIRTETSNYKYSTRATKQAAFNYAFSKAEKYLKSYVGGVFLVPAEPNAPKDAMRTSSTILCEADSLGTIEPAEPIYQNGKVICGKGTTQVTK